MIAVHLIFVFCFYLNSVTGQACDTSSDTPQCSDGERCSNNTCEAAVSCSEDDDCAATGEFPCVSDYCQPEICNSTGQCVNGQVCSQSERCVYRLLLKDAEEKSNIILSTRPSGTNGGISWYKDKYFIASIKRYSLHHRFGSYRTHWLKLNKNHQKTEISTSYGDLTIKYLTVEDEGFYTYSRGDPSKRGKYEYLLQLNVTPSLNLYVSKNPAEIGTNLTFSCDPKKVDIETTTMYWIVNGKKVNGTYEGRRRYNMRISLSHVVTKEDEGNSIKCVMVPRFRQAITVEKTINLGYAPTGKPVIQVPTMGHYKGEQVSLTCDNPTPGNPPCNVYEWIKPGGNSSNLPTTQVYTFIMDEFHAGNYTCQCSNEFGRSSFSDLMDILYLGEKVTDKGGLIAGCVIGVLVLVALVVAAVFVFKKYNIKLNCPTIPRNQGANQAGIRQQCIHYLQKYTGWKIGRK